ncbi:hypothetical protein [Embleya sp. MST-111070]|uniref:hypothetical protein n=1 Tax=Embleya sp. MST-111070 TaxID=3398231 RepID=UPI003F73CB08
MRSTLFRALVLERGWSLYSTFDVKFALARDALAAREREPALHRVTVSKRTFERWLAGDLRSLPHAHTRRVLEHMLGRPAPELFAPTADAPTTAGTPVPALLLMATASIDDIVRRYETQGPLQLVGETRLLRRMLRTLGPARLEADPDLARLAARAAGLLAYMAVNTGASHVADAFCAEALSLAEGIGDTETCMWAWATRSFGLYYCGRYEEADAAAAAGVALSPDHPQAIRLLVNGRARALARLGRGRETEAVIGRALDLSDRQAALPGGISSCIDFAPYSPARTLANAVTAHLSLGHLDRVLDYADQIDDLVTRSDSDWTKALVSLDVATALLGGRPPQVEHAMALGRAALSAAGAAPISSVWLRANELGRQADRWHTVSAVRDYADDLAARTFPVSTPWSDRSSQETGGR